MRLRRARGNLLVDTPSAASGDIAFNLIVFFLVCASVQPDSGRKQEIPKSEPQANQPEPQNLEVALGRGAQAINGVKVSDGQFIPELKSQLRRKTDPTDKIVVVRSSADVPYSHWVKVTGWIGEAGGIVTLQMEETQTVVVPD